MLIERMGYIPRLCTIYSKYQSMVMVIMMMLIKMLPRAMRASKVSHDDKSNHLIDGRRRV